MKRVLSLKEAAALLHMHENTLRTWCQDGRMVASKLGRSWKIQESHLQDLLDKHRHRPAGRVLEPTTLRIPLLSERRKKHAG